MDEPTLSELFARDPFKFSEQDEDELIKYYRSKYQSFSVTGKAKPEKAEVDLKDLGLL
jgi:hypothetical protein